MKKQNAKDRKKDPATKASGKRSFKDAEERAKDGAKSPGRKRAEAAGNLPAKDPKAKELAAKVPPPPPRRVLTKDDAWAEADDLTRKIGEQYSRLAQLDEQIKGLKKQRDATDDRKESLVRNLLDLHADMRHGQGRFDLKAAPSTGGAPLDGVHVTVGPSNTGASPTAKAPDAPKADAPKGDKPTEPKADAKDGKKDTKAA